MTKVTANQRLELVELSKSGKTRTELAKEFGINRCHLYQILKDPELSLRRKAARVRDKWGMSLAEYDAHVAEFGSSRNLSSPMHKYMHQRKHAATRGIAWEFDFSTWWAAWQESGKWSERGITGYVMARKFDGDTPYSPTTVYFCTSVQNIKDGYINNPIFNRKDRTTELLGVARTNNRRNPFRVLFRKKHLGVYPTEELARAAYLAAAAQYKESQS